MKVVYHFIVAIFCSVIILSCKQTKLSKSEQMFSEVQFQLDAGQLIDDWHQAAAEANFANYFNKLSEYSVFVGTDTHEVWTKEEFAAFSKPYFDKGEAWAFTSKSRNMYWSADKHIIWFDEVLDTWMGDCRGSGVLVFNEDKDSYEIEHYVLSLLVPNEKMKEVIKIIEEE